MSVLFLDSANLKEIETFVSRGAIRGVTTNPSLVAKESKISADVLYIDNKIVDPPSSLQRYLEFIKTVRDQIIFHGGPGRHLSVEVITLDPEKMVVQARTLVEKIEDLQHGRAVADVDLSVKIPVAVDTLSVINQLSQDGISVNATACMTAAQACLASDAGAKYVSFFYNRMIDGIQKESKIPGHRLAMEEIINYKKLRSGGARVICGSIRKQTDVIECWLAGADVVTASAKVIREIIEHPKTVEAIAQFDKDITAWLS